MTQANQSETHATGGTPRGSVTKKDMQEFLLECKMMASHNLCCYSANYLMDTPKEGMEEKHAKAVKDCEIVDALIALAEAQDEKVQRVLILQKMMKLLKNAEDMINETR